MKKLLLSAAVAACALICANQASAQDVAAAQSTSFEFGVTRAQASEIDANFNIVTARASMKLNKNFGAEVEGGFGLTEETVDFMGYDVDTKLDYTVGAFLTGEVPVSENVSLLGRIGYAKTQITASYAGYDESGSGDGVAGGIGVKVMSKSGKFGVRADYSRYSLDDSDIDAISLTLVSRF